jgi:D-alanyl-D-alanine carboxypeptidase
MYQRILLRSKSALVTLAATGCLLSGAVQAGPALVVDLSSGQVIHAEQATRPWYPASLTKLMTAYVALDAVRRGKITLKTPMRVSSRASRMAPSKMGFKPGVKITLENALKIIMVKSANDVSVTIAEGISGSVEGFAAQMNATARALGMYESHFVNPNGLHNPAHVSSARDMAVLARALFLHFPDQHELYGIGALRFGRRIMRNHNGLIGRYPGANGMKTGYVCAAGFNVVASATRYGKTVIAVVMGSPSATVRTLQAMALLDKGFAASSHGSGQLQSLPRSGYSNPPNMRSEVCNRTRRRELINQYIMSAAPPASAASASGFRSYAGDDNSSPAAFFAADQNKTFVASDEPGAAKTAAIPQLRLPPRTQFVPIPVYTGRAPGWSGSTAGPVAAVPETQPQAPPQSPPEVAAGTSADTRTAARTDEKIGAPLSLRGAHSKAKAAKTRKSKTARGKKASLNSRSSAKSKRADTRSRARNSRKGKVAKPKRAKTGNAVKARRAKGRPASRR